MQSPTRDCLIPINPNPTFLVMFSFQVETEPHLLPCTLSSPPSHIAYAGYPSGLYSLQPPPHQHLLISGSPCWFSPSSGRSSFVWLPKQLAFTERRVCGLPVPWRKVCPAFFPPHCLCYAIKGCFPWCCLKRRREGRASCGK